MYTEHEKHIKRCIELAKLAEGQTSPNPLVGAVVVSKDGKILSEGYHKKAGEAHAEVDALSKLGNKAEGATIYVNLEPCSHWGKTPPCADLIIKSGIKRLVLGIKDPNPLVSGRGIEKCKKAGIEVIENVLKEECEELNESFIHFITHKKPFIAIKTATTLDGKIATATGSSKWITSEASRAYVQKLRNKYDAIMTSASTVLADNPALTCRCEGGQNPIRILVDKDGLIRDDFNVFKDNNTKVIVAQKEGLKKNYPSFVEVIECPLKDNHIDLSFLTDKLAAQKITSILVEAGGDFNGALLKSGLVNKFYQFIAPKIIGDNEAKSFVNGMHTDDISDCMVLKIKHLSFCEKDVIIESYMG